MRRVAVLAFVVFATLTVVLAACALSRAVVVLLLSLAVAAAVAPVVDGMARRMPRGLALAIAYAVGLGVVAVLLYVTTGPLLVDIQGSTDELAATYRGIKTDWPGGNAVQQTIAAHLPTADLAGALGGGRLSGFAQGAVGLTIDAMGALGELVVILVLSIFWQANAQGFERLWLSLLPVDQRATARDTWSAVKAGVGEQIRSDVVQSLLAIAALYVGFQAMGLAHPTLPAVAGGLFRLVPLVGVIAAVGTTILAGVATDPLLAALAAVYMAAVLLLLELVVAPRFLRTRRYRPLLVTLVVVALTDELGLAGLLVAPAVAAAIHILFESVLEAAPAPPAPRRLAQVDRRVDELKVLLAARGPDASPELGSVVERLSRLVASAEGAIP